MKDLFIYVKTEGEPVEAIQMSQNPVYDVTTAGPPQPSTADTDAIQLQPNVLYGVNTEPDRGDKTTYYDNEGGVGPQANKHNEYEYVQLWDFIPYRMYCESE